MPLHYKKHFLAWGTSLFLISCPSSEGSPEILGGCLLMEFMYRLSIAIPLLGSWTVFNGLSIVPGNSPMVGAYHCSAISLTSDALEYGPDKSGENAVLGPIHTGLFFLFHLCFEVDASYGTCRAVVVVDPTPATGKLLLCLESRVSHNPLQFTAIILTYASVYLAVIMNTKTLPRNRRWANSLQWDRPRWSWTV